MTASPPDSTCLVESCDTPTELYLCMPHAHELEELIQEARFLWVNLDPLLQATKNTRPANQGPAVSGGGPKLPVPVDAIDIDPDGVRAWLLTYTRYDSWEVATKHADAGQFYAHCKYMIERARPLVHGPKARQPKSTGYIRAKLKLYDGCERKKSADMRSWFRTHGIQIKAKDLNNWVMRGKITAHRQDPSNKKEHPTYDPTEVYDAYTKDSYGERLDNNTHP